jgi:hypothetical protein
MTMCLASCASCLHSALNFTPRLRLAMTRLSIQSAVDKLEDWLFWWQISASGDKCAFQRSVTKLHSLAITCRMMLVY